MQPHGTRAQHILIAANSPIEGLALDAMLRGRGLGEVRVTSDGREIVPLMEKWSYRLLVLDANMGPRTAALDILEKLAPWITAKALAVLALTPEDDEAAAEALLKAGALDAIPRPFNRDEVLMRARWCLRTLKSDGPRTA